MAITTKDLVDSQFVPSSTGTLYTAPAYAMVTAINVTNTSSAYVTLTVYVVPSGGSAGDSNALVSAKTLAPGESYQCPEVQGQVLSGNDTLQAVASAASSLNIRASGVEFT